MRTNDIIYLLHTGYTEDDLMNQIPFTERRKVYANKLALGANEFSAAGQNGLKPAKAFKIHAFEYSNESHIEYKKEKYHIYRIAENGDKTTLYCERSVGDGKD
ncbi:hypothetical protein M5C72_08475 [Companilactobacillus allii]|uniref:Phage head-tail adapter protein n=1 Tax=Companilactobacillus allii TaxID=1847728 RepID=A0A1P8Q5I7_9LACO|nr:hypothetical protein [Companilactobacillus allii]APX73116.1 hypothetical protein BTM29_11380 [Companilactobacillus allii]USQ67917.1 hypothetical protein M5C72_08475 [Companilactobacillus allii]